VFGENFVDQRLVADVPAARLLSESIENAGINADRDQLTRFVAAQCWATERKRAFGALRPVATSPAWRQRFSRTRRAARTEASPR